MNRSREKRRGIVIAGSLIADVFYKIDTYPKEGRLTAVRETTGHVGGSGNLILDLAKIDPELPVEVSAIVGNDERGEMLIRKLSHFSNIDLSHVIKKNETSVTIVMNSQDTKQRTFFFIPAASDQFELSCIDWENINAKIFHLEYLLLMEKVDAPDEIYGTHGARILYEAKKRGMETSIDMVSEQSTCAGRIISSALRYTDYCAINEVEAEAVTGIDLTSSVGALEAGAEKALWRLREMGVGKWIVIHSPGYSYGLDCEKEEVHAAPSLKLPDGYIKGTTGAGDAFCSGILYGAYRGDRLENAMKLAAACAACSLSEENGTDGMRKYQDVLKLSEQYERGV